MQETEYIKRIKHMTSGVNEPGRKRVLSDGRISPLMGGTATEDNIKSY